jgi:hypothetical protein
MKLLGQLLVWTSLAIGAVAAATSYLTSLDLPDDQLIGLTLAAPAGANTNQEPLADKNDQFTAELLTQLRSTGVKNIRVKEFSFFRWRGSWIFVLALVGLALGGFLVRGAVRPATAATTDHEPADSPQKLLDILEKQVAQLQAELAQETDENTRCERIAGRIGQLQRNEIPLFIDTREAIISTHGMGGFAALMDSFSAAERQLNRAWSAAVDRAYPEATTCLDEAAHLLAETQQKLTTA